MVGQEENTGYQLFMPPYRKIGGILFLAPLAEGQRAIVMAWGRRASVRPSVRASVNFFFKKILLRNYWLDFNQISQECSLGGPLSNSFK